MKRFVAMLLTVLLLCSCAPATPTPETLENGLVTQTAYSIMNADTGRELKVGKQKEFTLVKEGDGVAFATQNGYLDLTGNKPAESEKPIVYTVILAAHERYQILTEGRPVYDTDGGETAIPTLATESADSRIIASGWYFTAKGEDRPLRLMCMGDSLTFGAKSDDYGWYDEFAASLDEYLDRRFVFVGPNERITATLDDTELFRHAGNSGWCVKNMWNDNPANGSWADELETVVTVYQPDVTFLMLSTNDCALMPESDMGAHMSRYSNFVDTLLGAADDACVIASTLPPVANPHHNAKINRFNSSLRTLIEDKGYSSLILNDNNTGFPEGGWVSDGVHLTEESNTFIRTNYYNTFTSYFDTNGERVLD